MSVSEVTFMNSSFREFDFVDASSRLLNKLRDSGDTCFCTTSKRLCGLLVVQKLNNVFLMTKTGFTRPNKIILVVKI